VADLSHEDAKTSDSHGTSYGLEKFCGPRRATRVSGKDAGDHKLTMELIHSWGLKGGYVHK